MAQMDMTQPAAIAAVALALLLSGCAPDAWTSAKATGFNGYLKTIQVQCSPLLLGRQDMSWALQTGAGDDDYNYFLDQTSKLCYQTIGPAGYRDSLTRSSAPVMTAPSIASSPNCPPNVTERPAVPCGSVRVARCYRWTARPCAAPARD